MSTLDEVKKEILRLTAAMIEIGLCTDQNYPSEKTHVSDQGAVTELGVAGATEISAAMKNRPYDEIYTSLREKRAYNLLLIDGAMIQFRYRFRGACLIKHVLTFYPSPNLTEYQNDPELYKTDILYADAISKDIVSSPIRFDFDENAFEELVHPKSHLTIGQYKNCRIPVSNGLTPYRFLRFVLRSFYNTCFQEYCSTWQASARDFPISVTATEKAELHISFG